MPFFDNQSRDELRRVYVEAWRKRRAGLPSEPLEAQVADVIALHPEYHAALERGEDALERDYTPEGGQSNPFLHMGLAPGGARPDRYRSPARPAQGVREPRAAHRHGARSGASHHRMPGAGDVGSAARRTAAG